MVESTLSFKRNFKIFDQTSQKDERVFWAQRGWHYAGRAHVHDGVFVDERHPAVRFELLGDSAPVIAHRREPTSAKRSLMDWR